MNAAQVAALGAEAVRWGCAFAFAGWGLSLSRRVRELEGARILAEISRSDARQIAKEEIAIALGLPVAFDARGDALVRAFPKFAREANARADDKPPMDSDLSDFTDGQVALLLTQAVNAVLLFVKPEAEDFAQRTEQRANEAAARLVERANGNERSLLEEVRSLRTEVAKMRATMDQVATSGANVAAHFDAVSLGKPQPRDDVQELIDAINADQTRAEGAQQPRMRPGRGVTYEEFKASRESAAFPQAPGQDDE